MAKEANPAAAAAAPAAPESKGSSLDIKKVLMIGVPIILIQTALVYFVFVKFVAPGAGHAAPAEQPATEEETSAAKDEPSQVLVIKDLIINPAGTNGTRFLLTTVGFEVPTAEIKAELEQKEVQVRDILNTILASKGLDELTVPQFKESLRKEITDRVNGTLRSGKVRNVYFSKFIIQ